MSLEVKHRRGTAVEHETFTGAEGEITYDSTDKRLVAHDGTTAGGIPLAKESEIGTSIDGIEVDMTDIADGYILYYDATSGKILAKQDDGGGGGSLISSLKLSFGTVVVVNESSYSSL